MTKGLNSIRIACLCLAVVGILSSCGGPSRDADILLTGGYIVDGSGENGYHADIYITGDRISEICPKGSCYGTAAAVIDVTGLVVTPGFVDVHAHGDPYSTPGFENFLAMGVTSIILGQDGTSPWIRELKTYLSGADSLATGVNIGYMAGHGTLRRGSGVEDAEANEREIERLTDLVRNAMDIGCFGISSGLEYLPGSFAGQRELEGLAMAVGEHQGMIMSHLRSEDDEVLSASLEELIRQGDHTKVHAAHLKSVYGSGEVRADEILNVFEHARDAGVDISADMYPYLASYTGIAIVFPPWAKTREQFDYVKVSREKELRQYLYDRVMSRNGPGATLFGGPPFTGMTLEEVAAKSGGSFVDVLMKLGPQSISAAYFIMDRELQDRLFLSPFVMAGSDGSPTMFHPRGHGTFARVLRYYVLDNRMLTLEEAIRKMSSLPAETINLEERGLIREGNFADIAVFDTTTVRDLATFTQPHLKAQGFNYVFVNGNLAYTESQGLVEMAGHPLIHNQD